MKRGMEFNNWSLTNDDVSRRHISVRHFDHETATDAHRQKSDADNRRDSNVQHGQQETERELMETVNKRYPDYCRTITITG